MSHRQAFPLRALAGSRRTEHQRAKSFPTRRRPRVHAPITGSDGSWCAPSGVATAYGRAMASGAGVERRLIGFVGTGTMGAPIARHLVAAGHDVRVFDRSSLAMGSVEGATPCQSAAAAATGAACVFLSLARASRRRGGGHRRRRRARRRAVARPSSSTSRPTRRTSCGALHERCAAAGVGFVDAPVSGGRVEGRVGRAQRDGRRRRTPTSPPSSRCSSRSPAQVFHVGPPGAGTVAKLVNNQLFLAAVGARAGGLRARRRRRPGAGGPPPHRARQLGRPVRGAGAAAARA